MSKLQVGDRVSVLDEDIEGHIVGIKSNQVIIETNDGFEMQFLVKEIVKEKPLESSVFGNIDVTEVIREKEQPSKRKAVRVKPKDRNLPMMEVDLHIHQITTSNRNMSNHDILNLQLDTAKHKLDYAIKNKIQKIVFIHGVGEGVLKMELEYLFGRYDNIKFYAADYQKYGLGATEVYVYQNI